MREFNCCGITYEQIAREKQKEIYERYMITKQNSRELNFKTFTRQKISIKIIKNFLEYKKIV